MCLPPLLLISLVQGNVTRYIIHILNGWGGPDMSGSHARISAMTRRRVSSSYFVLWREEGELGSANVTNVTTLGQTDGSSQVIVYRVALSSPPNDGRSIRQASATTTKTYGCLRRPFKDQIPVDKWVTLTVTNDSADLIPETENYPRILMAKPLFSH